MHVDEGKALGLSISYELLDFDLMQDGSNRLAALLDDAEQRGFSGLNITYPSKQAVIPLLHELAPEARALHSVNTRAVPQRQTHRAQHGLVGFRRELQARHVRT